LDTSLESSKKEKKKPSLKKLSKGLPKGWQAFLDASSGDVYYGNVDTKETTWTKPE
jgi:hypothetical protein